MLSRALVHIIVAPGIFWDALQIRTVPTDCIARLHDQVIEPVPSRGVFPIVHFVGVQGGLKVGDLGLCGRDPRLFTPAHNLRIDDGRQGRQDDEH